MLFLFFPQELAEYEKMADHVKVTQRDLEQDGFSKNPFFHGIIAEVPEQHKTKEGHTKIGYALYFYSYSSFKGRAIYMEDLYVMPEFRGTVYFLKRGNFVYVSVGAENPK
uniref:Uncharacterized protein n=1 Tax=Acanthochromis polyacanthus TaxID=80966 RepID=A0A3Q1EKR8_9TELE